MLISKEIITKWNNKNKKWFESKNYIFTGMGSNVTIRTSDLKSGCQVKVFVKCDNCGKTSKTAWHNYIKTVKENGKTYCNNCAMKLYGANNMRKVKLNKGLSFSKWIIDNYGSLPLEKYWSDKNSLKPFEISYSSNIKVWIKCLNCGEEKFISANKLISQGLGCQNCSDGISYPNKIGFSFLKQLGVKFVSEYSPEWAKKMRYDFYFNVSNKKYILEMDGEFHTKDNRMNGQTKEESKEIDNLKDLLAKQHNINIIRIDCQKSEIDYIKRNILNSILPFLFDLSAINWNECEKYALCSLIQKACDLWNCGINSPLKIAKELGLGKSTTIDYLKKGAQIGLCNYNPISEAKRQYNKISKKVFCYELNETFDSVKKAGMELKINCGNIATCCRGNGRYKTVGGYHWAYIK